MMSLADTFNLPRDLRGPDGTVYKLRKPTLYEQGEFQRWLEHRAHEAIDRSTDSEERKLRRHHLVDVDAGLGKYEWDGPLALEAMWTPAGFAKYLTLIYRDQGIDETRAEELLASQARETAAIILTRAAADPKVRADLALMLGAMGLPMDWMESEQSELFFSNSSTHPSTEPSPNSEASPTTNSCSSTPSSVAKAG